jgi:hypothetical protein
MHSSHRAAATAHTVHALQCGHALLPPTACALHVLYRLVARRERRLHLYQALPRVHASPAPFLRRRCPRPTTRIRREKCARAVPRTTPSALARAVPAVSPSPRVPAPSHTASATASAYCCGPSPHPTPSPYHPRSCRLIPSHPPQCSAMRCARTPRGLGACSCACSATHSRATRSAHTTSPSHRTAHRTPYTRVSHRGAPHPSHRAITHGVRCRAMPCDAAQCWLHRALDFAREAPTVDPQLVERARGLRGAMSEELMDLLEVSNANPHPSPRPAQALARALVALALVALALVALALTRSDDGMRRRWVCSSCARALRTRSGGRRTRYAHMCSNTEPGNGTHAIRIGSGIAHALRVTRRNTAVRAASHGERCGHLLRATCARSWN